MIEQQFEGHDKTNGFALVFNGLCGIVMISLPLHTVLSKSEDSLTFHSRGDPVPRHNTYSKYPLNAYR